MKRTTPGKSYSWWWDSHVSPKNSKWLSENLEKMDLLVKEMLIEEDGDSLAKKAEMYYQRRPELISHVEDFYRMYRALAERYDNVTGELRKNIPSELQSQGSGNSYSQCSSPFSDRTPDRKPSHCHIPFEKAAGFHFFLGSGGSSDLSRKGSDDSSSSSLEAGSESDDGNVVDDDENTSLIEVRVVELQKELCDMREKLRQYENSSTPESEDPTVLSKAQISNYKGEINLLLEAMEAEILQRDLTSEYYKSGMTELKAEFKHLSEEKSHLEFRISEQEQMIHQLKYKIIQEKSILESNLQNLEAERTEANNECERHTAAFKLKIDSLTSEIDKLNARASKLVEDMKYQNEQVDDAQKGSQKLMTRVRELEEEVEKQKLLIMQGAEGKREAIRQLCFSIQHYRDGYKELRGMIQGHYQRSVVIAT